MFIVRYVININIIVTDNLGEGFETDLFSSISIKRGRSLGRRGVSYGTTIAPIGILMSAERTLLAVSLDQPKSQVVPDRRRWTIGRGGSRLGLQVIIPYTSLMYAMLVFILELFSIVDTSPSCKRTLIAL